MAPETMVAAVAANTVWNSQKISTHGSPSGLNSERKKPEVPIQPPAETPNSEYPMILTTGRQLEHWHTGSMTRRASVLDWAEPEAHASLHPKTLRRLGVKPGERVLVRTRRGEISIAARADRAVSEDMVFIPFAYVEAAANILTNPQLDPYGKIPEFKFSACRVTRAEEEPEIAAE